MKILIALKKWLNRVFIEGMSGMALGLFATLIIGTIINQIGLYLPNSIGKYVIGLASVAKVLTGAGIAVGVASKFKASPLVTFSAATAGMVGAYASKIISGTLLVDGVVNFAGPGEPLGSFLAAYVAIEIGMLVSGKTKIDILVTPFVTIMSGSIIGLLIGPPISSFMTALGALINWATVQQPILMGILVAVIMGMILTLPISSAALGIILGLNGIAAGAAVIGCSAQMIGFAVSSYRENKFGGLLAQGIGTSMLQVPNIFKKPIIWLPPILTSAILGPISSKVLQMTCDATGSGMGTSGLIGQISTFSTMTQGGMSPVIALTEIIGMHIIAPAIICLLISELMRKLGYIKENDMKLDL